MSSNYPRSENSSEPQKSRVLAQSALVGTCFLLVWGGSLTGHPVTELMGFVPRPVGVPILCLSVVVAFIQIWKCSRWSLNDKAIMIVSASAMAAALNVGAGLLVHRVYQLEIYRLMEALAMFIVGAIAVSLCAVPLWWISSLRDEAREQHDEGQVAVNEPSGPSTQIFEVKEDVIQA